MDVGRIIQIVDVGRIIRTGCVWKTPFIIDSIDGGGQEQQRVDGHEQEQARHDDRRAWMFWAGARKQYAVRILRQRRPPPRPLSSRAPPRLAAARVINLLPALHKR